MFPPLPTSGGQLPSISDVTEDAVDHDRQVILTSQATHTEQVSGAALQYDRRANLDRLAPQSDALAANSHRRHEPLMNANRWDTREITDVHVWVDA